MIYGLAVSLAYPSREARGEFPRSNDFYLPSLHVEEVGGGGGSTLWCYHFLENEGGWLVIGPQLQDMTQVQCSLLEMPVGLQDLAQLNHLSKTEVIIVMLIWVKK